MSLVPEPLETDIEILQGFFRYEIISDGDCLYHSILQAVYKDYQEIKKNNSNKQAYFSRTSICKAFKNELAEKLLEIHPKYKITQYEFLTNMKPDEIPPKLDEDILEFKESYYQPMYESFKTTRFRGMITVKYISNIIDYSIYIINYNGLLQDEDDKRSSPMYCFGPDSDEMFSKKKAVVLLYYEGRHYETLAYKQNDTYYTIFDNNSKLIQGLRSLYTTYCKKNDR